MLHFVCFGLFSIRQSYSLISHCERGDTFCIVYQVLTELEWCAYIYSHTEWIVLLVYVYAFIAIHTLYAQTRYLKSMKPCFKDHKSTNVGNKC